MDALRDVEDAKRLLRSAGYYVLPKDRVRSYHHIVRVSGFVKTVCGHSAEQLEKELQYQLAKARVAAGRELANVADVWEVQRLDPTGDDDAYEVRLDVILPPKTQEST